MEEFFAQERMINHYNSSLIDLLSMAASSFSQHQLVSIEVINELRASLRAGQASAAGSGQCLLQMMLAEPNEFLSVLLEYFGSTRFSSNLLRHSLRVTNSSLLVLLSDWGKDLVQNAHLVFNRPFIQFENNIRDSSPLFSSVLVELAASFEQACTSIEGAAQSIDVFLPHGMAGFQDLDESIASSMAEGLGFAKQSYQCFPQLAEETYRNKVALAVKTSVSLVFEVNKQIRATECSDSILKVSALCEELRLACERLSMMNYPSYSDIHSLDLFNRMTLESLCQITEGLKSLKTEFTQALRFVWKAPGTTPFDTQSIRRRLIGGLVKEGNPVQEATQSIDQLFRYLRVNNIGPDKLIASELAKVHSTLKPNTLELLKTIRDASHSGSVPVTVKSHTLKEGQSLTQKFDHYLSRSLPVLMMICCLFFSASCGLKQQPKSDLIDYRPDIPFRDGFQNYQKQPEPSSNSQTNNK